MAFSLIDPVEARAVDLESICLESFYRETLSQSGLNVAGKMPRVLNESYSDFLERFPKG